ncbi:MAG: efflux RND transporter periplasmic adaptor subunit [Candidatus Cloacimonadales bacterium]|jgi:RND family efflux transporter MFP subunit|nr:efflux RND transporter periplasmic adaptor subunit [Candidatus Cloacimonadales bacterium]
MKKKKVIIFIVIVFFLLIGFRLFQTIPEKLNANSNNMRRMMQGEANVKTGLVTIGDIAEEEEFSGTLNAKNKLLVSPRVSGQLTKIKVNIGDRIAKGSVVALIDPYNYQQAFEKAQASLAIANANFNKADEDLKVSAKELENYKELRKKGFLSQSEYDQYNAKHIATKATFDIAKANIESANAELKNANANLKACEIKAIWDTSEPYRYVGERFVEEGIWLNTGQNIMSVLQIEKLTGVIFINEERYTLLKKDMNAVVKTDSWQEKIFNAKITNISAQLQEDSRQARVELEVDNREGLLKPGMFSRIILKYREKQNVRMIPANAYYTYEGKKGVFLVDPESKAVTFTEIVAGISNKDFIEVLSPEIEGEVVTVGQNLLNDGKIIASNDDTQQQRKGKQGKK